MAIERRIEFSLQHFAVPFLINQKNYITDYVKKDEQFSIYRKYSASAKAAAGNASKSAAVEADELDDDEKELETAAPNTLQRGAKVVVVHLDQEYTRVGLATDTFPKTVPSCVARKRRLQVDDYSPETEVNLNNPDFEESVAWLDLRVPKRG